jgi:hypothetical protein
VASWRSSDIFDHSGRGIAGGKQMMAVRRKKSGLPARPKHPPRHNLGRLDPSKTAPIPPPMLKTTKRPTQSAPPALTTAFWLFPLPLPDVLFIVPIAVVGRRSCRGQPRSLCPDICPWRGALGPRLARVSRRVLLGDVHGDRRRELRSRPWCRTISSCESRFASCTARREVSGDVRNLL